MPSIKSNMALLVFVPISSTRLWPKENKSSKTYLTSYGVVFVDKTHLWAISEETSSTVESRNVALATDGATQH